MFDSFGDRRRIEMCVVDAQIVVDVELPVP
jgi:hypothetical protein